MAESPESAPQRESQWDRRLRYDQTPYMYIHISPVCQTTRTLASR